MIYEVNTDELLFELFCRAIYAPQDLTEIRQMYDGLSNKGRSQVKAAHETIGRLLNRCPECGSQRLRLHAPDCETGQLETDNAHP